jgi:hypothetical protein
MPQFARYIGIDYSGAETPDSSCRGLRVYSASGSGMPEQVQPPPSPRRYWTRRGLAEWPCNEFGGETPTIVGIDHAFSFPIEYIDKYGLPRDWPSFLLDFQKHWPTHEHGNFIDLIRDGDAGDGRNRMGENTWLRLTERWKATAKSVFLFDVQGSVAKSTFAGLALAPLLAEAGASGQSTSGRLTGGRFPRANQSWPKSIRHCGRAGSQRKAGTVMSKLRTRRRHGYNAQTSLAH